MELHNKELFSDILKGSSFFILDSKPIYIKHFSLRDASEIDVFQSVFRQRGLKNGLLSEHDQELKSIKQKTWDEKNKNDLSKLKERLETIKASIKENKNISQKILLEKEYKDVFGKISQLEIEKKSALGLTLESFVSYKIDNYYILSALYLDPELKKRAFETEEFEDLPNDEISDLILKYNDKIKNFTSHNIKTLSLIPSFSNLFHLCADNPNVFFGKSVVDLSFYQAELFQYGKYYKHMFSMVQTQPPDDIRYDPIKLDEWFEFSIYTQNVQERVTSGSGRDSDGVGIVGDRSSLKKIGVENTGIDLAAEAKKNGGTLDFKEFIKLHRK